MNPTLSAVTAVWVPVVVVGARVIMLVVEVVVDCPIAHRSESLVRHAQGGERSWRLNENLEVRLRRRGGCFLGTYRT